MMQFNPLEKSSLGVSLMQIVEAICLRRLPPQRRDKARAKEEDNPFMAIHLVLSDTECLPFSHGKNTRKDDSIVHHQILIV